MVCIDPGMSCSESHKSHEELVQKRCRCAASQSNSVHMFLPLCFITGTASPCAWLSTMSMASWGVSECITAIHWNIFESPNEFTKVYILFTPACWCWHICSVRCSTIGLVSNCITLGIYGCMERRYHGMPEILIYLWQVMLKHSVSRTWGRGQ